MFLASIPIAKPHPARLALRRAADPHVEPGLFERCEFERCLSLSLLGRPPSTCPRVNLDYAVGVGVEDGPLHAVDARSRNRASLS